MKKVACILVLNILCATGAVTLHADTIYVSRTTYESAHPNKYVIDFSSYGPSGTLYNSGLTASTPFGNVSFQGSPQPRLEILDANFFGFAGSGNLVLFALDAVFLAFVERFNTSLFRLFNVRPNAQALEIAGG